MSFVVPAVLPTSRDDLEGKIALFAKMPRVSRIQIDTVDGHFAAPASWPYTAVAEFRAMQARGEMLPALERFEYEIDLMNLDPESAGAAWLALGATRLTFHAESATDLGKLLARMHAKYTAGAGFVPRLVSFGIALNLGTDLALIEPVLAQADYVQFMGIAKIGRQGQPFDARTYDRVRAFRKRHPDVPVQVDGGMTFAVARELAVLGVSNIVAGSSVLGAQDPVAAAAAYDSLDNLYGV